MDKIAIAILVGLFSLGLSGSASASGPEVAPVTGGQRRLRELLQLLPLDDTQRSALVLVARGESGFNPLVGLGIPALFPPGTQPNLKASAKLQAAEARAARRLYQRNAGLFAACGHPADAYSFGSGGWCGLLPASGLAQLAGTPLVCWAPSSIFDERRGLLLAVLYARALQGWAGFKKIPTVATLRRGWGLPSAMGEPIPEKKRAKFQRHANEIGEPQLLDREVKRFPGDPLALWQALGGDQVAALAPDFDPDPEGNEDEDGDGNA